MVSISKRVHRGLVENITHGGGEEGSYKDRSGQRTPGEHLKLEGAVSGKAFVARVTAQGRVFGKESWWDARLFISSRSLSQLWLSLRVRWENVRGITRKVTYF